VLPAKRARNNNSAWSKEAATQSIEHPINRLGYHSFGSHPEQAQCAVANIVTLREQ